jgi:uncharacterized protein (DUF433 family)
MVLSLYFKNDVGIYLKLYHNKGMEKKLIERITVDPLIMSGHPCIRGMRVTVSNILRLLAAHYDYQRILEAYPYLESADIDACLEYAAILANDREVEIAA